MAYRLHAEAHRTCPHCGRRVYKSKWEAHGVDCLSIALRFGTPADLARLFRDEPELRLSDLMGQLPGVREGAIRAVLLVGGVTREELRERARTAGRAKQGGRRRCRRCRIYLDVPGVRPGSSNPALCWWCDGTEPEPGHRPAAGVDTKTGKES